MRLLRVWVVRCAAPLFLTSTTTLAESPSTSISDSDPGILVHRVESSPYIAIDGILDEPIWKLVQVHDEFIETSPETLEPAPLTTEVRMFCDNRGLYVSADMLQDPDSLIQRLSAPDQGFLTRDYFMLGLDTSGEGRYGNWFQLNLGGSRADGTVQPERQFSSNWDGAGLPPEPRQDGRQSSSSLGRSSACLRRMEIEKWVSMHPERWHIWTGGLLGQD